MPPERRTLLDTTTFVVPQFWTDSDSLWWDVSYIHAWLIRNGWATQRKQKKWFENCFKRTASEIGLPAQELPVGVGQCTSDTLTMVSYLWALASDNGRCIRAMSECTRIIQSMIRKATLQLDASCTTMVLCGHACHVECGGHMSGLAQVCIHKTTRGVLQEHWRRMHERRELDGDTFNCDRHSVADVAKFFMRIMWGRRISQKPISPGLRKLIAEVRHCLCKWIAGAVESYVRRFYSDGNPEVHRAPPALKFKKRTYVSPEASWELMEKARDARATMAQAIKLRSDQPDLGCGSGLSTAWAIKRERMYEERAATIVCDGLMHWNMAADPGSHSYKEVMPSVLFAWEKNEACHASLQLLLPGKAVLPRDCNLADDMIDLANDAKLERVAAYRQVQGLE